MEARIQQLEQTVQALIQQFLPPVTQRLAAAEARADAAEARIAALESGGVKTTASAPSERKRIPTDAPTYYVVKGLADQGMSEKQIEAQTGVSYTTVRAYLRWKPEQLAKKNQEWQEKLAKAAAAKVPAPTPHYLLTGITKQSPEQASPAPEVASVTPTPPPPVQAPQQAAEDAYRPVTENGRLIEEYVEYREVPTEDTHEAAGWHPWTDDQKGWAEQHREPNTGFPLYPPCEYDTIVKVQYMNETYSDRIHVQHVDWTSLGGVLRWRIANDQTSPVGDHAF